MKPKQTFTIIFAFMFLISLANALTISDVNSVPKEVAPGQTLDLELTIENEIGDDLENVIIGLDLAQAPFAPYGSSTEQIIEQLDDGDDENIKFDLISLADAQAGIYKIPVMISYFFNETLVEKTSFISLTINAKPSLQVGYEGDLIKGRNGELDIRITNIGLTEAKFLNVEVSDVSGLKILGNKQVYIGDIESDDFDSVDFKVFVSESSGNVINLPVKLSYRDATNKEYVENISLALKAYSKEQAIELGIIKPNYTAYYVGGVVALIVVWIIYRKIRKRMRNKKKEVGK